MLSRKIVAKSLAEMKTAVIFFSLVASLFLVKKATGTSTRGVSGSATRSVSGSDDLVVTILHINDFHAHIEQVNENLTRCRTGKDIIYLPS